MPDFRILHICIISVAIIFLNGCSGVNAEPKYPQYDPAHSHKDIYTSHIPDDAIVNVKGANQ